jgi:hypothetical protein
MTAWRCAGADELLQYAYQIALNGSRLGFYEPFRQQINKAVGYGSNEVVGWTSITAGASSGIVGGTFERFSLLPLPN